MADQSKPMSVCDVISRIEDHIVVWQLLVSPSEAIRMIQPDHGLIDEARSESWRAIYDTIREFEEQCLKRGYERARVELSNSTAGKKSDHFIAATSAFLSR